MVEFIGIVLRGNGPVALFRNVAADRGEFVLGPSNAIVRARNMADLGMPNHEEERAVIALQGMVDPATWAKAVRAAEDYFARPVGERLYSLSED